MIGGKGHNWIQGGAGNDEITGGDKNDHLRGRAGNDVIDGGKRHDRIFGSEGNDLIIGGAGNDFIQGESGRDQIFGGNGNDLINGGLDNDTINAGSGSDDVQFAGAYAAYSVVGESTFTVTDNNGNEGTDQVSNAQIFRFADINVPAEAAPTAAERVVVRPIVVSNSDGTNPAEFFGSDSQEANIKFMIDDIFAQANIDIFWESEQSWNHSFANVGNTGGNSVRI